MATKSKAKTKATAKTKVAAVLTGTNAGKIHERSSGSGSMNVNTVHIFKSPEPKIGESVLFFPGAHDDIFPGKKLDRYSARVSNVFADGKVNLNVFNDGPEQAYRTNIDHRSTAAKGDSSWEWVESM